VESSLSGITLSLLDHPGTELLEVSAAKFNKIPGHVGTTKNAIENRQFISVAVSERLISQAAISRGLWLSQVSD